MGQKLYIPPLSEPEVVHCYFASGIELEMLEGVVRIVGWVDLPTAEGDQPERRIVARLVIPNSVAREMSRKLQRVLSRHHH